ncbi:MAG: ChaN family lipoprotein [Bdellovibrionaceae bacterium]|nr:ChaN family lipoprotein [Pseudobdellovibrionaceae bacterium]
MNFLVRMIGFLSSRILTVSAVALVSQVACASGPFAAGGLFDGQTSQPVTLAETLRDVKAGDVVIVAESHGFEPHHRRQVEVLQTLAAAGLNVSVGMEFFYRGQQPLVDAYLADPSTEKAFLHKLGWTDPPFSFYREQVLFPLQASGRTVALNAPRALTSAIAKKGVAGLTPAERAQLPSDFVVGNDGYLQRFMEVMGGGHIPSAGVMKYFEAQSAWDDVMATEAISYLQRRPEQTLVILVGDFHAAYGGGLGDRLTARGYAPKVTISQLNSSEYEDSDLTSAVRPHPIYGPRADAVSVAH